MDGIALIIVSSFLFPIVLWYFKIDDIINLINKIRGKKTGNITEYDFHGLHINRDDDVKNVINILKQSDVNLLTIVGAQGIGKTTLAKDIGVELNQSPFFPDGVFLIDLKEALTKDDLYYEISSSIKGNNQTDDAVKLVSKWLKNKVSVLFILDNFEQLIELSDEITGVLQSEKNVKLLITSQRSLGLGIEKIYPLSPLKIPTKNFTKRELKDNESVKLFIDRYKDIKGELNLNSTENLKLIAKICQNIEGNPLGIQIIADQARLSGITLSEILEDFDSVWKGSVDQVIKRSYELLPQNSKELLHQLSIFENGFFKEASNEITLLDVDSSEFEKIFHDVSTVMLRRKIIKLPSGKEKSRFYMLPAVNFFLKNKLSKEIRDDKLKIRWGEYYLKYIKSLKSTINTDGDQLNLAKLEKENIIGIHSHFIKVNPDLAAEAILEYTLILSLVGPHRVREELLTQSIDSLSYDKYQLKIKLINELSRTKWTLGKWEEAYSVNQEAIYICENHPELDKNLLYSSLLLDAINKTNLGKQDNVVETLSNSYQNFISHNNKVINPEAAMAQIALAVKYDHYGHFDKAAEAIRVAESHVTEIEYPKLLAKIFNSWGLIYWHNGYLDISLKKFELSLALHRRLDFNFFIAGNITNMGLVLIDKNKIDQAIDKFEYAELVHQQTNNEIWLGVNNYGKGRAYFFKGRSYYGEAIKYLTKSYELLKKGEDKNSLAMTQADLAQVYQKTQQYRDALIQISECVALEAKIGFEGMHRHFLHLIQLHEISSHAGIKELNEIEEQVRELALKHDFDHLRKIYWWNYFIDYYLAKIENVTLKAPN